MKIMKRVRSSGIAETRLLIDVPHGSGNVRFDAMEEFVVIY